MARSTARSSGSNHHRQSNRIMWRVSMQSNDQWFVADSDTRQGCVDLLAAQMRELGAAPDITHQVNIWEMEKDEA